MCSGALQFFPFFVGSFYFVDDTQKKKLFFFCIFLLDFGFIQVCMFVSVLLYLRVDIIHLRIVKGGRPTYTV